MKGAASFLKHASDVASFYGFRPVREIERTLTDRDQGPNLVRRRNSLYSFATASAVSAARAHAHPQEPVLAFYATPSPAHTPLHAPAKEIGEFGLQVVGTPESVGEVVLIKTTAMIVREWGLTVTRVRMNALGDRDSQQRFTRELMLHARKHLSRVDPDCRDEAIRDPYMLYRCGKDACREVMLEAPRAMHFLSEKSRGHFRSVLEHVEHLGLPYEIDDTLVGDERGPHLAFALDFGDEDATIVGATGGRYDEYLRRETRRKESVGVGASIFFRKKGSTQNNFMPPSKMYKPKVYFAQLGLRAKLQGLTVVDMLRAARVPVQQSFDTAHLGNQLAAAREVGVSHLLIMGQREALDGTLIVRSMQNSAQTTIQIADIPRFLKTLR